MLPYFAFHLRILASLMPCLWRKSATETLASCFFNIPMIYSSEKRVRFMLLSFAGSERSSKVITIHKGILPYQMAIRRFSRSLIASPPFF